ncbi:SapC family protein [Thalassotalea fonticola]|uniref:SapC family protein n=1 Tax=Thalassotalea fonticola TaxID=3065649 RepID=A0ABZ0GPR1_9GAMM|nr:SapC family protein [Colwelliaceae bacterium S1-1]
MADIQAINNKIHSNIKIKHNPALAQSANRHFVPLVVQEFAAASQDFPIVFIKDSETGQFRAIALLGLKPEENLFVSEDSWLATYKPQSLSLYPFLFSQQEGSDQGVLCFDVESDLVNEEEGDALFDSDGKQSTWLNNKAESVVKFIENNYATQGFIKMLIERDLLTAQTLNLKLENEQEYALNGLYTINEKALNELSDEQFSILRTSGALKAIYASLLSMQCIHNLASKKLAK